MVQKLPSADSPSCGVFMHFTKPERGTILIPQFIIWHPEKWFVWQHGLRIQVGKRGGWCDNGWSGLDTWTMLHTEQKYLVLLTFFFVCFCLHACQSLPPELWAGASFVNGAIARMQVHPCPHTTQQVWEPLARVRNERMCHMWILVSMETHFTRHNENKFCFFSSFF